ncbi:hypothetical protein [Phocaeicola plebeius]|uniref:hypothetical protein n=1 Tax=Phocaeicola plebeius TaxID=310297 RepID=UPI0026ED07B4|nr:hypothetical protein [Phocaeicola plebeius]
MQAVAELVQFLGGGQYLHGLLAAKSPGDAFLFLRHGAYTGGTFRHFGQMVHQQAVCLVLTGESFHKVQQVGFFFHQEGAERVYLCRTHEILAAGLHGLQQAVRPQPPDAVVPVVRLFPADERWATVMSRLISCISPVSASISRIRPRSCTKMAAMLQMTATKTRYPARIFVCNLILCLNSLLLSLKNYPNGFSV